MSFRFIANLVWPSNQTELAMKRKQPLTLTKHAQIKNH